jgi:hypothetical protein
VTGDDIGMLKAEQKPKFAEKFMGGKSLMVKALKGNKLTRLPIDRTVHPPKLSLSNQPKDAVL